MQYTLNPETYLIAGYRQQILVPDQEEVKRLYEEGGIGFPYWSRVWPSAIAMSDYILRHPFQFQNKQVIELAAGLGLPSFIVSQFASSVTCSDYVSDAVENMKQTISFLGLKNCNAILLDWNEFPGKAETDILLLSDINYDPSAFPALTKLINQCLDSGVTIILSTPQRLMARDFIKVILDFIILKEEIPVDETLISVFVLQK